MTGYTGHYYWLISGFMSHSIAVIWRGDLGLKSHSNDCRSPGTNPRPMPVVYETLPLRYEGGSGVRLYDGPDLKLFILVGWGRSFLSVAWPTGVQLVFFFCSGVSRLFGAQGSPSSGSLLNL